MFFNNYDEKNIINLNNLLCFFEFVITYAF